MAENKNNQISEQQLKAIELLANGETITDTGKIVGVSRQTVTEWKKTEKFKSALDEYKAMQANLANVEMNGHAKSLMDNLIKIALTGHSEKNRLDATIYGLNRIYGSPTAKTESINKNENKEVITTDNKADITQLLDDVEYKLVPIDNKVQ